MKAYVSSCRAAFCFLLLSCGIVNATSYPPEGMSTSWTQPDGTVLSLKVLGDEFSSRTTTEQGYSVILDTALNAYCYATVDPDTGAFVSTGKLANGPVPEALPKGLKEAAAITDAKRAAMMERYDGERARAWEQRLQAQRYKEDMAQGRAISARTATALSGLSPEEIDALASPVTGTRQGLMILVQFPDDPNTASNDPVTFPTTQSKIQRYCNDTGYTDDGNTGSIKDYFYDQSNGLLTFTHTVSAVVTLPHPRAYYNFSNYPTNTVLYDSGITGRMLVNDAIAALKSAAFNFSSLSVDGSNRIVSTSLLFAGQSSGVWAFGLWPHAWSMSGSGINVGTAASPRYVYRYQCTNAPSAALPIGTNCHELGHLLLGYPDFYDTDRSDGDSNGLGNHCLMSSGNHVNNGFTPGPIDIYLKNASGWATLTDLTPTQSFSGSLATTGNVGYRIRRPSSTTEYFLFENRGTGDKWAAHVPDKGLMIWHVDEAVTTGNQRQQRTSSQHYFISLEQSDGRYDLETASTGNRGDGSDLYDNATSRFTDSTSPAATWWSGASSGVNLTVLSAPGATMSVQFGASSLPVITSALSANAAVGSAFSYQITASNSPTSFSTLTLPSGLSVNTSTGLISGTISTAGSYNVTLRATNAAGTGQATLVITASQTTTTFSDDFDPSYDTALWSAFGGTVAANTNGTAAGTGSTGNSLWFGGDGSRFATTVPVDTRSRDQISFKIALANGSASPWENADTGEEVVLEYSTNGSTYTQLAGPYSNKTWQAFTITLPTAARAAATKFQFRQLTNSGAPNDHWAIEDVAIGNTVTTAPEITVEQPVGTGLTDGSSTVNFGASTVGGANSLTFSIRNDGNASLTGLTTSFAGSHPGDFSVTTAATAPLAAGAATTFIVRFSPAATGARSAILRIASNDANENPFDINLSGSGITAPTAVVDDFDPSYDTAVWASFGGTVAANTNGTAAGTGSTGNSLWFGGDNTRFARTVAMDVRAGASVSFKLVQANGGASPWENADTGEEVVVEYSTNGGSTFTQIGGPYANRTWQSYVVAVPAAAQTAATHFQFRQLSHSGADFDHWALEDLSIGQAAAPEIVVENSAGTSLTDGASSIAMGAVSSGSFVTQNFTIRNTGTANLTGLTITITGTHSADFTVPLTPTAPVLPGGATTFTLRFAPGAVGARSASLHIANNDANENPFDLALSGTGSSPPTGTDFRILTLTSSSANIVDHDSLTADDRGGIAASTSRIFVTGDSNSAAYDHALTSGAAVTQRDGLCSNLATGEVYTLALNGVPFTQAAGQANQLIRLDPVSGATTTTIITLARTLNLSSGGCGVFSGHGRLVLYLNPEVVDISFATGAVTSLGNMITPAWMNSESWAVWGVAEFFSGQVHLAYADNSSTRIVRSRVPDGSVTTISTFSNLSDMANFTVVPSLGRWYFHYEGTSQFGGTYETLGYASATFSVGSATAPSITSATQLSVAAGAAMSYQITATNSPTSYGASGLPAGLGIQTSTGLISGTPTVAGNYTVTLSASNAAGTGTASLALAVQNSRSSLQDDFDPGIDAQMWSQFSSTVAANMNGQAAGAGSQGNSLWFGGDDPRFAITVPVDTRTGGTLSFKVALGNGSAAPWENADGGEEVILEASTDGTTFSQIAGPFSSKTWQTVSLTLPSAAMGAATRFRFSQISHSGADYDHWAIEDVVIGSVTTVPEIAVFQPAGSALADGSAVVNYGSVIQGVGSTLTFTITNQGTANLTGIALSLSGANAADYSIASSPATTLAPSASTTFGIRFTPSAQGARSAALQISSNDADENPFDVTLNGTGSSSAPGTEFRILTLQSTGASIVDHDTLTSDDRAGIAVGSSRVFVTGDNATASYTTSSLSTGQTLGRIVDGLCSNLATEDVYTLAYNGTPHAAFGGSTQVNQLILLDPNTGAQTATVINLSATLPVGSGNGVFSGYGRVVLHNGSNVYQIALPSGVVTNLGAMAVPSTGWYPSESWASWGVAENISGQTYLAYRASTGHTIVRARVPDGAIQTIATFTNLSDMASWSVSPTRNRWYFHFEGTSEFGGTYETLGYANATFQVGSVSPPVITSATSITVARSSPVSYQITASGSPTSYSATSLPSGLSINTSTGLITGSVSTNGNYTATISATNNAGTGSASLAIQIITAPTSFSDDFDPNYDSALWRPFGGTVLATSANVQGAGSGSTGNSLWFGGDGSRFAETISLDTRTGGYLSFTLAQGSGASAPWETADSGEEVVVEYSLNGGTSYVQLGGPYNPRKWQRITLALSGATQSAATSFRFRQLSNSGADFDHWAIEDVEIGTQVPVIPEIALEDSATGAGVSPPNPTILFPDTYLTQSSTRNFAIKNYGAATLSGLSWQVDGANPGDFDVQGVASDVASGGSLAIALVFSPQAIGTRTARLRIYSNDPDENPFDVTLSGTGLDINFGPVVLRSQPTGQALLVGGAASFSVNASGQQPITYQWRRNRVSITGANQSTYNLSSALLTHAGSYDCVVSNVSSGVRTTVVSNLADLVVVDGATSTRAVRLGGSVDLVANVGGTGLLYQWERDRVDLPGATARTLRIGPLNQVGQSNYLCRVTSVFGDLEGGLTTVSVYDSAPLITLPNGSLLPTAMVGDTYQFAVPYDSSASATPSRFSAVGLPAGLTIHPSTGIISGVPTAGRATAYPVTLTASNDFGSSRVSVSITVSSLTGGLAGTYIALIPPDPVLNADLGGRLDTTVAVNGTLSGRLTLGTLSYPLIGRIETDVAAPMLATATVTIPRTRTTPLVLSFTLDGSSALLTAGTLGGDGQTLAFDGWRRTWSSLNPAFTYAGYYTLGLGIPSGRLRQVDVPQGVGFASFSVSAATGGLTVNGYLADKSPLICAAYLGPDGQIAVYQLLYATTRRGSIIGTMQINEAALPKDNLLGGMLDWFRPVSLSTTERTYRAGFSGLELEVFGGFYTAPVAPDIVMDLDPARPWNAALRLDGWDGNDVGPAPSPNISIGYGIASRVTLPVAGTSQNLRRTTHAMTASTGRFSGSYSMVDTHPFNVTRTFGRTGSYWGILVTDGPGSTHGVGFHLLSDMPSSATEAFPPIRSGPVALDASP